MSLIVQACNFLVIVFSAAAAYYWLRSALVKVPEYDNAKASNAWKNASSFRMIEAMGAAMKAQAGHSARGALCAAIAAALTAIPLVLGYFTPSGTP